MRQILLVYASTHGHTAKVAGRIAKRLRLHNLEVDLHNASADGKPSPTEADGVVVAGSVHRGHHQRELVDWVKHHRMSLADTRTLFVSVSLTAADDTDDADATTRRMIDDFVDETGWTPTRAVAVAGALQYREYDVFTRTLMRLLMRLGGHPTDVSHDHDLTDWDAVDQIADAYAESFGVDPAVR